MNTLLDLLCSLTVAVIALAVLYNNDVGRDLRVCTSAIVGVQTMFSLMIIGELEKRK